MIESYQLREMKMNALEQNVKEWVEEQADGYDSGIDGVIEDLREGGCQSGMVSHLIYYSDTESFYKEHQQEISTLLGETIESIGSSPSDVFGDKWLADDPLANETQNQNLLAWFAFEETAFRMFEKVEA